MLLEMPTIAPSGDAAALLGFGEDVSLGVMARTHSLARAIEASHTPGVQATVVGRSSVLVYFDPLSISFNDVEALVKRLIGSGIEVRQATGRKLEIPTVYGGEYGPDLRYVADYHGITEADVIRLQTAPKYTVLFLGFAPGLSQMMGLPPEIVMNRKRSPEIASEGSVLIASQVVVYPVRNPSGWWCIGRTPLRLFQPYARELTYLLPGDEVRFTQITEAEYARLRETE
jgi:inhibitor of KinA